MKTKDDAEVNTDNPIPKPVSGLNYSFWKQIHLECTVAPVTQCNNFRWHTDGSDFGTGIALKVGNQFPIRRHSTYTGYEPATGLVGETGDAMLGGHGGLSSISNAFSKTSASPLLVTCSEAGEKINAVGETTNYIVLQAEVSPSASPGTPGIEYMTWHWDEI